LIQREKASYASVTFKSYTCNVLVGGGFNTASPEKERFNTKALSSRLSDHGSFCALAVLSTRKGQDRHGILQMMLYPSATTVKSRLTAAVAFRNCKRNAMNNTSGNMDLGRANKEVLPCG
jgi:hypothetical protein